MLTLATMKTRVGRRIQKPDAAYAAKIADWLQARYTDLLMRHPWRQTIKTVPFSATAGTATVTLPRDVRHIFEIHDLLNDKSLNPTDAETAARERVADMDQQGIPDEYYREEDTVNAQPSSASVIAIVSASASDTSQTVRVWGTNGSGIEITESVALTGATPVNTTNSFARVDRISKSGTTVGTITATSNSGGVTVATIAPNEVSPRHPKIRLIKTPLSAYTYQMTYKVQTPPLVYDEDVPILPCGEILIIGAYAEALEEQRQFQKAVVEWGKYDTGVERLWAEFEQFSNVVPRSVPRVERASIDVA